MDLFGKHRDGYGYFYGRASTALLGVCLCASLMACTLALTWLWGWSRGSVETSLSPLWVLESTQPVGLARDDVLSPRWARLMPVPLEEAETFEEPSAFVVVPEASAPAVKLQPQIPAHLQSPLSAPAVDAKPVVRGITFNGRPLRKARTVRMLVTAYSPDARSCGKWADNITASGYSVWTNGMKLVAADTTILPFGSIISVPGYDGGNPVPVLDRGGAIKGMRLDLLYPTHEIARKWGKKWLEVTVWEYADK